MKYEELQIPDPLKGFVQCIWTLKQNFIGNSSQSIRTFADGYPGLIVQHSADGTLYQNDKKLPPVFLYGQSTKHNALKISGQFNVTGIFFHPNALKTVFGLNASELTDSCINLDLLSIKQGKEFAENLLQAFTPAQQINMLSSFILSQIKTNRSKIDDVTQYGLSRIISSDGLISLKELMHELNISKRTFERRFKESVGMSPKLFSRICRFRATLRQLNYNKYGKLSDIAFENDYADQSHFIRSFKEFSGFSPNVYQQKTFKIAENFSLA